MDIPTDEKDEKEIILKKRWVHRFLLRIHFMTCTISWNSFLFFLHLSHSSFISRHIPFVCFSLLFFLLSFLISNLPFIFPSLLHFLFYSTLSYLSSFLSHSSLSFFAIFFISYTGHMRFLGEIYMYGLVKMKVMKFCILELIGSDEVSLWCCGVVWCAVMCLLPCYPCQFNTVTQCDIK